MPSSSISPPSDLLSYSKTMHMHTKRQMEAANMSNTRRSRSSRSAVPSMPNGSSSISSSSSSRSDDGAHEYHD
ncbi:Uu.00g084770.m01.CDS01 [Anthostomella pinea]|uniref:Uu.00g084770.m01.CDS01 n=1 Tax=Anthostomella pinea TaxID=933095 RepID=A0AAI8YJL7_9PEZI|nr:Uu.00g084770.m01.CDS01 [Anthostomella pinea]